MSDLILYIVKNLVTNPDAVSVEETHDGGEVNLNLTVDPVDMGLVIGKSGQTIKAIRKILIVKAMADNVRVNLQLAEPEGGRPDRSDRSEESESKEQVSEPAKSVDQSTGEPENTETPAPADTAETPEETVVKKPKKAKKPKVSEEEEKLVEKHVDEIAQQD